ncbi:hypothetical protein OAI86_07285, partial [Alphaproteobacteria bacterium]|nr:hypothetical protein [Alphaproteobacteria bacterium]
MNNKYKKFKGNKRITHQRIEDNTYRSSKNILQNIKLKNNQIIISGKHSTLSALKNTQRKL